MLGRITSARSSVTAGRRLSGHSGRPAWSSARHSPERSRTSGSGWLASLSGLNGPVADPTPLYRRATAVALVAAPVLLLADNILHPREFKTGGGNEARQLAEIAQHAQRWQLAHVLGFLAILMYVVAVLGLAHIVRRTSPRLGLWGGVLGTAGLMGLAGVIAIDGFTWGALGQVYARPGVDRHTMALALDEVQNSSWSLP